MWAIAQISAQSAMTAAITAAAMAAGEGPELFLGRPWRGGLDDHGGSGGGGRRGGVEPARCGRQASLRRSAVVGAAGVVGVVIAVAGVVLVARARWWPSPERWWPANQIRPWALGRRAVVAGRHAVAMWSLIPSSSNRVGNCWIDGNYPESPPLRMFSRYCRCVQGPTRTPPQ